MTPARRAWQCVGIAIVLLIVAAFVWIVVLLYLDKHQRAQDAQRADRAMVGATKRFGAAVTARLRAGRLTDRELMSLAQNISTRGFDDNYALGVGLVGARTTSDGIEVTFESEGRYYSGQGATSSDCYRLGVHGPRSSLRSTLSRISCNALLPELVPGTSFDVGG